MPGAGLYGWKHDLIVAVDTLFLKEDDVESVENPLLANVIAWLVWRMSPIEASSDNILALCESLGELVDGYVINVVRKVDESVEGYKITLARTESHTEYLDMRVGSYLRQVNVIDPAYPKMKWAASPKRMWRGGYRHFLQRLNNLDEHAKLYAKFADYGLNTSTIEVAHAKIQKTIYIDLNQYYLNNNVGAVCVGLVDEIGTSVSCKLNDEKPFTELEYIDLV
jgi:hypothetical protein